MPEAPHTAPVGETPLQAFHDIKLTLADWTHWDEVARRLADAGAELSSLRLVRGGGTVSATCRARWITAESARSVTAGLLDDRIALSAAVEHLFLSRYPS